MKYLIPLLTILSITTAVAADSVDVYFTYKSAGNPGIVYLPGEFNNWANNSSGVISPNPRWNMTKDSASGVWYKTVRLQVGGQPGGGVPGAYQYKLNETGCSSCWLNDPLNPYVNAADNSNSYIYIKDPTIFHFLPNQRSAVVPTVAPLITAYIFPKVGGAVDTSTLSLRIDGTTYTGIGEYYNATTNLFAFPSPPIVNGNHKAILTAGTNVDSVTFITQGGFVHFLNQFPFTTIKTGWLLNGLVADTSLTSAQIVRNGVDTFSVQVSKGSFSDTIPLAEGLNAFVAVVDSSGSPARSSPISMTRVVNHTPSAKITYELSLYTMTLHADSSSDPDAGQSALLSYHWSADTSNPAPLAGVEGSTASQIIVPKPGAAGDYFLTLIASDPDGHSDTTRSYFTVKADSSIVIPTITSNPSWARQARVYFMFPKAMSLAGTINAAALRLQYIKDLGFNVIWLMPVMKNAYPIDNGIGVGYNIVDFYNVAPEYGTNQDLKNFVAQAHALGIRVILDVTPNHTSRFHPWSQDAHLFKTNSFYWNWYEHHTITSNTNGLGDCLDADGFNYYCGFSDQLLNYNWTDPDAQRQMINVYTTWVKEFGLDGYRFDVYWGPHRRYGEQWMGQPVRAALKHIKPDILLLAEDDGTGVGTQTIYADYSSNGINGGVDAAYDFSLYFNQIQHFNFGNTGIDALHSGIDNGGYYPGENSLYMRFMESQDADRIVYYYSNGFAIDATTTFEREMPMASVLFTCPGFPMIWNGQEVGWGYGITTSQLARTRSVIDFGFQGRPLLAPHYQKLAHIRGQFPAFTQHKLDTNHDGSVTSSDSTDFVRIPTNNNILYAFSRPYQNQNGLTVVNFTGTAQNGVLNLTVGGALKFDGGVQAGTTYYLNNLYANTRQQFLGSALDSIPVTVPSYGSAIYTVSLTADSVYIQNPILSVPVSGELPYTFALRQNYPNPFNPATTIDYSLPKAQHIVLKVYNLLGQEVATLVDSFMPPGAHTVVWDAGGMPSGVYFYRIVTPDHLATKKMLLVR